MGTFLSTNPFSHPGTRTQEQCEQAVHVNTLMAGETFKEIRDRRLYGSGGFERYCQETFRFSKRHVNRLIRAYELYQEQKTNMGPMGPNFSERHYRELTKLKTRQHRTAAVIEIQRRFGNRPTAKQVQEVVEDLLGKRRQPTPAYVGERAKTIEAHTTKVMDANEEHFMKIKHLEEDVERLVNDYGEYFPSEKICDLIIETAARLKEEDKESEQPPPGQDA